MMVPMTPAPPLMVGPHPPGNKAWCCTTCTTTAPLCCWLLLLPRPYIMDPDEK